jgi:hypothetical protein
MSGFEILIVVAILYAIVNWILFAGFGAPGNRTPLKKYTYLLNKKEAQY